MPHTSILLLLNSFPPLQAGMEARHKALHAALDDMLHWLDSGGGGYSER